MTPIMDAVQAVCEFTQQPIADYAAFPRTDRDLLQEGCCTSLLQLCHNAPRAERDEALAALAPAIQSSPDAFQASRLAMLCGILVEWGADPAIAASAILDRLQAQLASARSIATTINVNNEADLFGSQPDAVKAWKGLRYLCMAAMTMLCTDTRLRQTARSRAGLINAVRSLAPVYPAVKFLDRLFNLTDGEELIVLHPQANKGFRVRLEAIASNFHLFTLLQAAIVGDPAAGLLDGPRASRMVIGTATGAIPHDRIVSDSAVFSFATPSEAGGLTEVTGEGTPRDIPHFEGERVLLLGPAHVPARSWDSTFFTNLHDALRSNVELVEILSAGEVESRLRRLQHS